jgi:hypothetical protein
LHHISRLVLKEQIQGIAVDAIEASLAAALAGWTVFVALLTLVSKT